MDFFANPKAIKEGFAKLQSALRQSLLLRPCAGKSRLADGLNVTRALTVKYQDNLSAGRVQTPTLALVRSQEMQIESFRPQTYHVITLNVGDARLACSKNPYQLKERSDAEALVKQMSQQNGRVTAIEEKVKTESAPLPYDLTEIQRANQRYGFLPRRPCRLFKACMKPTRSSLIQDGFQVFDQ